MKRSVLVSVVVPVFNGAKFIENTIKSLLSQTYNEMEIIVVNDGSTDDTIKLVENFKSDKIKIANQNNQGVSTARNNGLKIAQGEYLVFFDADDIMPESFIEDRVNFLDRNLHFDFCCSDYVLINEANEVLSADGFKLLNTCPEKEILLFTPNACTTPSSFMFKINFIKSNDLSFDPLLSNTADRLFILDCCKHGKGAYFEGSPFYHIMFDGSMSTQISEKNFLDFKLYVARLIKKNYFPKNIRQISLKIHYRILVGIAKKLHNYPQLLRFLFYYTSNSFIKS